jgi:2-methylcitrate dehydratase PrpD
VDPRRSAPLGGSHPCFRSQGRLSYLDELARFACRTRLADLSAAALERTRWLVADTLPVIGAGMREPQMQSLLKSNGSPGKSWIIGAKKRSDASTAALLNGTAGTFLELNEGNLHARGHPSIQVLPAAVALAQELGASGEELLIAIAVGYEVCARIGRASKVRIEVHPHGTWGVMGAAVAAGRLRRFTERRMRELLNVAATIGLATSRQTLLDGATVRNIFAGHSGHMGLMATRLVEAGFTGGKDGPAEVFGKVLSDGFDAAKAVANLGGEWLLELGYFKLHPTGRYVHSAIDALEDLLEKTPSLDAKKIERIHVEAYRLCAMLAEKRVTSSFGARFSVPFALATILHHGGSSLAAFEEAAVSNEAIQALAARVEMSENREYTGRYPAEQRCDLRIALENGQVLEGHCIVTKGERSRPHTEAELREKFLRLASPLWGEPAAGQLLEGCLGLERIANFGEFSERFNL